MAKVKKARVGESLWHGPEVDGITQSLLSRWLVCRERFRLLVVEGLREEETFNHKTTYGSMWHVCEEATGQGKRWQAELEVFARQLCMEWPTDREDIDKWYNVCVAQYQAYLIIAGKKRRTGEGLVGKPVARELVFNVPYSLQASGRTVFLRGKFDGIDRVGKNSLYIIENKSKGDINEERIRDELPFNLQTMMYSVALAEGIRKGLAGLPKGSLAGVVYNVVRRPLSDWRGKFNISQRKGRKLKDGSIKGAESKEQYYRRLQFVILENAEHFFMRWRVELTPGDLARFRMECFDPMLEELCRWWYWVSHNMSSHGRFASVEGLHYRMPFGIYNPILEGRQAAYHKYLRNGDRRGLVQVETLFRELV